MLPNAVWLSSEPYSPALYSCLHRSRQSPAPGLLSRHTTYPPRESVPTILDRRSRKGYVGNWPQSHLRRSTHFRETARCPSFKVSITSLLVSSADSGSSVSGWITPATRNIGGAPTVK